MTESQHIKMTRLQERQERCILNGYSFPFSDAYALEQLERKHCLYLAHKRAQFRLNQGAA